jgi:DNA-binding Lrp family transcriptional regulator
MSEVSDVDRRIVDYLRDSVASGQQYFRARHIADAIGLSSKQVGARLPHLDEKIESVEIEKWGRARSTTWRVTES